MPVTKSAKKKFRQDKKRKLQNKKVEDNFKDLIKKAIKKPSSESVKKTISAVDKAVKNNIIHKNKAARIKSKLNQLLNKKIVSTSTVRKARKKTKTSKTA